MDTETLLRGLHPLEIRIVRACPASGEIGHETVCSTAGLEVDQFRRGLQWLLSKEIVAVVREDVREAIHLTELGQGYARTGTPETYLLDRVAAEAGLTVPRLLAGEDLPQAEVRSAFGKLKKAGILTVDGGAAAVADGADTRSYHLVAELVKKIAGAEGTLLADLDTADQERVRSLIHKRHRAKGVFYTERSSDLFLTLTDTGRAIRSQVETQGMMGEEVSRLTPEMLRDGSWRGKSFRAYSFDFAPPRRIVARRHPYREFLDYLKYKLVALGFQEMRGPIVECEFWNMDALYMPQFHAARNIHDAYGIRKPTHAKRINSEVLKRVAATHEDGGETGSKGWGYQFNEDKTHRLVLRTQGTALSARTVGSKPDVPGKYFAFARCFRPDTVDATHACDFLQIEGIVLGQEINFQTLLGLLKLFAMEVAKADEVKFVPGYFPFTEPSVEAHMRHPRLGWIELGGAGIFRPEVTRPLGIDVPVLAWGLGIDRMAMVALKINDIRELFSTDLEFIRTRRLEMELT